jgi:hypothetical protein
MNENNSSSIQRQYPGKCVAIILFMLNVILPGVGTMFGGCCIGGLYGKTLICSGVIQFITFPCIVGWVLSICTGILFINQANEKTPSDEDLHGGITTAKQGKL